MISFNKIIIIVYRHKSLKEEIHNKVKIEKIKIYLTTLFPISKLNKAELV